MIRIWPRSSRLMVPMTRSQWAFIRGACGALLMMRRSSARKTLSNVWLNYEAQCLHPKSEVDGAVPGHLGRPLPGRVGGDAGDVQAAGAVFEEYQRVQTPAERGVEVEEVRRDDALGLGGEELPPGRAGAAWYRVDARVAQ